MPPTMTTPEVPWRKAPPTCQPRGTNGRGLWPPTFRRPSATPDHLIATKASDKSNRPVETITPLAAALHLTIDSKYADTKDDVEQLATVLRTNPVYAGKTVLICWHHGKIPKLAQHLGVSKDKTPDPWPPDVFDWVWRIDYEKGKAKLTILPQKLLYGDASTAP